MAYDNSFGSKINTTNKAVSGTGALKTLAGVYSAWATDVKAAATAWGIMAQSYMAANAYMISCWKKPASGTAFQDTDLYSWCVPIDMTKEKTDNASKSTIALTSYYAATKLYFHPLLQDSVLDAATYGGTGNTEKAIHGRNQT